MHWCIAVVTLGSIFPNSETPIRGSSAPSFALTLEKLSPSSRLGYIAQCSATRSFKGNSNWRAPKTCSLFVAIRHRRIVLLLLAFRCYDVGVLCALSREYLE